LEANNHTMECVSIGEEDFWDLEWMRNTSDDTVSLHGGASQSPISQESEQLSHFLQRHYHKSVSIALPSKYHSKI
jgi:hypothetical protein